MVAFAFAEWLFREERELIDRAVIQGYDRAFQQGLENLIQRTKDPVLRSTFEQMRSCPIRTSTGCTSFCNYLVGALIRNNVHRHNDLDQALNYLVFRMLSPVGESGGRKGTLWDFDESRPYAPGENPLEARFKTFVAHDIRTLAGNRIKRLRTLDRPRGTISIIPGRGGDDAEAGIAAHEIPGRESGDDDLIADVEALLAKRNSPELPLVDLFKSILNGTGTREQRRTFGHSKSDLMRRVIVKTIEDYAHRTDNWQLTRLLDRIRNPEPASPRPPKAPPKEKLPPDEQDFRSIVDVLEKHGRRVGSAILGKARRRWLERKPRNPNSPYANRLADVLAQMVAAGVLERQGLQFVPGPRYGDYLDQPVLQK